jgi:hypothetical protein
MKNNKWRIEVQGGGQITDTGDYSDPYYVLTNSDIELITRDEIELGSDILGMKSIIVIAVNYLNELNVKWENWKQKDAEYILEMEEENHKRTHEQAEKWKEIAGKLYQALFIVASDNVENEPEAVLQAKVAYCQYVNELL